jgi:hypothetical protein
VIKTSARFRRWPQACWVAGALLSGSVLLTQGIQAQNAPSHERVSFYFAAHEDDWQLFMNPSPFQDVADPKTKTVFVHITAGDAGGGMSNAGRKHPYYLARENGAEVAIRFMADSPGHPSNKIASSMQFGGHLIYRVAYKNTAAYFLRLPDGNGKGSGYEGTGFQSLARLANGEIKDFSAIDGSTIYHGWTDLVSTLRAVLDYERADARAIQLNVAESNANLNPGDHSDHQMTAKAALEAAKDLACARRVYYVDYASAGLPENLAGAQRDMESSVLAVTAAGILALDHGSIWHPYYRSYLGRNYFRVEEGAGPCQAPVVGALHAAVGPLPKAADTR